MWRLKPLRHKASGSANNLEEFKHKRREFEKALRQARRDKQLISKRLLQSVDVEEKEKGDSMETGSTPLSPEQVREMIRGVQSGGEEKAAHLASLRKALRNPESQLTFIKSENSMHMLIGQLSSHNAQCQLEAARCLHELSHSTHPSVGQACLPAGPYLLTYLSSQSTKLTELCLYTLGNLCPDSAVVREKLLAQGIVSALANCIHNQRYNLVVVEAVGFTLSQLLQAKNTNEKIIPAVMASGIVPHVISALTPDPEFGYGPATECTWCLHYLVSSNSDNSMLIAQGALSQCSAVLITLGGAVAQGNLEGGIELLIWPLLRCLGNLLVSGGDVKPEDTRLLAALCVFSQVYLHPHPALSRESLWALNNLTAGSSGFCSGLLLFNMVPILIRFLSFSKGINSMALRVLGNIAHHGTEYCVGLTQAGLLTALCATLKMAEPEVVTLSLEVLYMLVSSCPQVVEEFMRLNGVPLLEAVLYNSEGEQRVRAAYLLDHHFPSFSEVESFSS
ncbi:transmembrane and coiled-coil domain-containing protein 6 isoform X1 [Sinocyclocheilus rhinocerous]|uniref:IBB domain-containing protein n=1 Tax=Sinocyclocheilus rhinocerous TaxID=307959 RepID=A0A673MLN4_9TELE|nr:PREDICTED: transmembrane and coiled-coil domain-containing protein 6 isoform X1 [Sinocyclocheilus rhinocerous]XP_016381066.1 PREDICTED: transmembrane and coiled-coil domain-containing protein 6 isoform X1 [Sinocyclocheilus rhinocerous]